MARTTAYTQFIVVPPERLWAVLADPVRWPEWNPAVASVRLREAPGVGVRGDYLPSGRANAAVHARLSRPFTITSFVPGRELVVQQPEPAGVMRISWTLTPCPGGTELVQRVGLIGISAPVFWYVIGGRLQADARVGFARLRPWA